MWIVALILGALLGFAAGLRLYFRARRAAEQAAEDKQLVLQEKQIVVDFMHDMVEVLGENPTRVDLFQRIVHAAILSTGAMSACMFERTSRGTMRGVALEGLFPPQRPLPEGTRRNAATRARFIEQVLHSEEFPASEGVVGQVAHTGEAVLIADASTDSRVVKHDDPALAVRSLIAAPVIFRGEFHAVLCVVNPTDGLPFNANDLSLVQALAEQAGLVVHNQSMLEFLLQKRQLDLDLALASGIQQMLLPASTPAIAGFDLDTRYRAAQRVGGDLYDLLPLPDGRLGIAVADVSGKGIAASLLMAICRTNLRQVALHHESPAAALAELNRTIGGQTGQGMYITMIYAIVDPVRDEIVIARAGHELPLIVRGEGGGRAEFLASEGMPLGLVPPHQFESVLQDKRLPLARGDVVVFYTDGVTEAPNESGQEFSGARLADLVRNLVDRSPKEIDDAILHALERFTGRDEPHDDLTLVTLRRTA